MTEWCCCCCCWRRELGLTFFPCFLCTYQLIIVVVSIFDVTFHYLRRSFSRIFPVYIPCIYLQYIFRLFDCLCVYARFELCHILDVFVCSSV